jgi:hypothetical protein
MIVTQLDRMYAPWLDLFLASLRVSNPTVRAYVELVNFPADLTRFFEEKYPEVDFAGVSLEQPTRNAVAHRKVDAALAALARHPKEPWYLLCDVDLLFRSSLNSLATDVVTHDAGVVFRDGLWESEYHAHLRVACGFVAFKDARLLGAWKDEMARPACLGYERASWFYDQITLFSATQALQMDYLPIAEHHYLNRWFSADAAVWSANLEPKELMYLRFVEEFDRLKSTTAIPR